MNALFDNPNKKDGFSSTHTSNLPPLFGELGVSPVLAAGAAGFLLWARAVGAVINIHRVALPRPAGLAFRRNRLWVGAVDHIGEFVNVPGAASKLPEAGCDACFLPFRRYTTGDIDVQEMACDRDGRLWFANARFSCLCTLDETHSFVPQWFPPFIGACVPEDRCRLNGLALRDGEPAYVTALGESDRASGWRENAHEGGVVVDVKRGRVIARSLCLPHSPRWHNGELWFLEAGRGLLNAMDPDKGDVRPVAELPGFARGMELIGDLAFIGLSASPPDGVVAGQTPLAGAGTPPACGLWVVDIHSGRTVGFIDFKGAVREIHAVQLVPARYPEMLPENHPLLSGTYVLPDSVLHND